jgi:hypothetical protein
MTLETVLNEIRYLKRETEQKIQTVLCEFVAQSRVPIKEVKVEILNGIKTAPIKANDCSINVTLHFYPIVNDD